VHNQPFMEPPSSRAIDVVKKGGANRSFPLPDIHDVGESIGWLKQNVLVTFSTSVSGPELLLL